MEPISLTTGAIATLILTKAFEKAGEKLGERVTELSGRLLMLLRKKAPDTASAIELARQYPPSDQSYLISAVETAAKDNHDIAEAVLALASEAQPHLSPNVVHQIMVSGIVTEGSLKTGDLTQRAKRSGSTEQIIGVDVEAGSIEFGNLTQES